MAEPKVTITSVKSNLQKFTNCIAREETCDCLLTETENSITRTTWLSTVRSHLRCCMCNLTIIEIIMIMIMIMITIMIMIMTVNNNNFFK